MRRFLKHFLSVTVFLLCSARAFSCPCDENLAETSFQSFEKVYIVPEGLKMTSDRIFVHLNDQWVQTDTLFTDAQGMYIHVPTPSENGCREGFVPCRNCDRCVKWYYNICPHCNKPV